MKTTKSNLADLSEEALIDVLVTCDGQGKEAKNAALNELLKRAYDEGYEECLEISL